VIGIESRGFILGALVACELGTGFVPVRKAGKLPWKVLRESYSLEYGQDTIEMHEDAVEPGQSVLIVDDLIATGGTAAATCTLAEAAGARVLGLSFLVELCGLGGRERLGARDVHVVLDY
jgi:adenine phosphoribosyltransferase